jgi:hypothetical protein
MKSLIWSWLICLVVGLAPAGALAKRGIEKETLVLKRDISSYVFTGDIIVSPDGTRVAHAVSKGGWVHVEIAGRDQKVFPEYERVDLAHALFSPDSQRLAYEGMNKGREFVVLGGVEGEKYDDVVLEHARFSSDGKRFAYLARNGGSSFMVVDGKPDGAFGEVVRPVPVFSKDGKEVAYGVKSGEMEYVILNGKKLKGYDAVSGLVFAAGNKLVYAARERGKWTVVVGGEESKKFRAATDSSGAAIPPDPVVSPDGGSLAYAAGTDKGSYVVRHLLGKGKIHKGKTYASIGEQLIFGPDGKRLVYRSTSKNGEFVVDNGKEGAAYRSVGLLTLSPDGKQLAFKAKGDEGWILVLDGEEDGAGFAKRIVFDPLSEQLAWVKRSGKHYVVLDDEPGPAHASASSLTFSSGGERLAYVADGGTVVAGVRVLEEYQALVCSPARSGGNCLFFASPDVLRYVAMKKNGSVFIVTYRLK